MQQGIAGLSAEAALTESELPAPTSDLDVYARRLEQAADLPLDAHQKTAWKEVYAALVRKQAVLFPALRRRYAVLKGRELWENDVAVRAAGKNAGTIIFTGSTFVFNRHIQLQFDALKDELGWFRFKRAEYFWSPQSEYKWMETKAPADTDVGYWESGVFMVVPRELVK